MIDNIKIFFNPDNHFTDLDITINKKSVEYVKHSNYLDVNINQHHGINILRIKLKSSNELFEITDVKVNDSGIRMGLYLSYVEDNGARLQPRTVLNTAEQTWVLPYGSPMSFWISLIHKKLGNNYFGKDFYKKYDIYYPEPIDVPGQYPQLIHDFFNYDFDFTVVDKTSAEWKDIPYLPLLKSVDTSKAFKEISDNIDYFFKNKYVSGQLAYNTLDDKDLDQDHWIIWWFGRTRDYTEDLTQFPKFKKFLQDLEIQGGTVKGFLAFTKPSSFASPHIDDMFLVHPEYVKISGCAQLYIPISPDVEHSDIKLAGVGVLPSGPIVFNNDRFVHGVYNNSDQMRIYLSLRVDPDANPHLFKKPTV